MRDTSGDRAGPEPYVNEDDEIDNICYYVKSLCGVIDERIFGNSAPRKVAGGFTYQVRYHYLEASPAQICGES